MQTLDLMCKKDDRRGTVRSAPLLGLDYVEVSDDQLTLFVYLLGRAPSPMEQRNLALDGGTRIRDVRITSLRVMHQADPTLDDFFEVTVDKPGDFSTYTLRCIALDETGHPSGLPMQGFDAFYASVDFTFKAGCPSPLDCKPTMSCPPAALDQPAINYLGKDYESFRKLILDRLALTVPQWQEEHAPDIGVALTELLAYTGDSLSYFQDAVATEAYLGTARERISVRRHARLVDYRMHEGVNARAWLTIATDSDVDLDSSAISFITAFPGAPSGHVLVARDLINVPQSSYEVFQPLSADSGSGTLSLFQSHTEIPFYTWRRAECCLLKGSTSATLLDGLAPPPAEPSQPLPQPIPQAYGNLNPAHAPVAYDRVRVGGEVARHGTQTQTPRALRLKAGDFLLFEEVLGPRTGNPADADPRHRQVVQLTRVTPAVDTLFPGTYGQSGQPVLQIEWAPEDALTFPLCLSARNPAPDCRPLANVSVARGNIVLVEHGANADETLGTVGTRSSVPTCPGRCQPASTVTSAIPFRPVLSQLPLSSRQPLASSTGVVAGAAGTLLQQPRRALPVVALQAIPPAPPSGSGDVRPLFTFDDLSHPEGLAKALKESSDQSAHLLHQLSAATRQALTAWDGSFPLPSGLKLSLIADLTALLEPWNAVPDLLDAGPGDRSFVVEVDNDGYGHLRFGDGQLGRAPDAGTAFRAIYRVGNGAAGNVGAESLSYIVFAEEKLSGVSLIPRNPLPASGGVDPEPLEEVKQFAPFTFSTVLERAVTADDYSTLAEDNARRLEARNSLLANDPKLASTPFRPLQSAKAVLRWTGSWYTARVALDPEGEEAADSHLAEEITFFLEPFRRMGHDLLVCPAQYVPLKVTLAVCVLPDYLSGQVEAAVRAALGNTPPGFFAPDNLSFGDGLYASQLIATVQSVPGVQSVTLIDLERLGSAILSSRPGSPEVPPNGVLRLGPLEIARLSNDPSSPEDGVLTLQMRGGR